MTLHDAADSAINQISLAIDAPSMGYEDGADIEAPILQRLASESGFTPEAIREEMEQIMREACDLDRADDGPYGRIE